MSDFNSTANYNIESFKLNYRACIPLYVLLDNRLSRNELALYGLIEQMESSMKDVFINDRTLSKILGVNFESRMLGKMQRKLKALGYLKREKRVVKTNNKTSFVSCWNTVKKSVVKELTNPPEHLKQYAQKLITTEGNNPSPVPEVPMESATELSIMYDNFTPPVPQVPLAPVPEVPLYTIYNTQELIKKSPIVPQGGRFFSFLKIWNQFAENHMLRKVRLDDEREINSIERAIDRLIVFWPELNRQSDYRLAENVQFTEKAFEVYLQQLIKYRWFMVCGDTPHTMRIILRRSNFEKGVLFIKTQLQKDLNQ